jgi:hypothetical protein
LPSTPLKATEKRGGPWRAAMGVEQTEIDALASLRPDLLRQAAEDAIGPFYDHTLDGRVFAARGRWLDQAQEAVERAADAAQLKAIRDDAAEQLENMRRQVDQLNAALRIDPGDVNLPPFDIPEAQLDGRRPPVPLVDSRWEFAEQCQRLIASKAYDQGAQPHPDAA